MSEKNQDNILCQWQKFMVEINKVRKDYGLPDKIFSSDKETGEIFDICNDGRNKLADIIELEMQGSKKPYHKPNLEKLEQVVSEYWDSLPENMQDEIRVKVYSEESINNKLRSNK